jgi:DNA repair protein RadC
MSLFSDLASSDRSRMAMPQSEAGQRLSSLRDQILTGRGAELSDEGLLELLLSTALHRQDVRELAAQVLRRFGLPDDIGRLISDAY